MGNTFLEEKMQQVCLQLLESDGGKKSSPPTRWAGKADRFQTEVQAL